ncbi:hypothetical protein FPY71_01875 [Aureimonas fodinaquatilis]|uniref:Uncharacterized protein n=1 Tax=Aureimonas fodinaquatilis TaxID=2565783 RepID=A0A5B0E2D2_9HYPH|nr:hypothetical protein [Aureimonas fodinaquatilis]KAA0971900.1 hypothetical protein FPY71_01875 [Aureimonas fodinaquatilis]
MAKDDVSASALLTACDAMLREVGGFPLAADRLQEAEPVIAGIVRAIRTMDEVDVSDLEPAFIFRVEA